MATLTLWQTEFADGPLPPVCGVFGEQTDDIRTVRFTWVPGWVWWFAWILPVGASLWCFAFFLTRQSATMHLPVCAIHPRNRIRKFRIPLCVIVGAVIVVIGLLAFFPETEMRGVLFVKLLAPLVAILLLEILPRDRVWPTRITEETITLTGVNQAFADAVRSDVTCRAARADDDRYPHRR